jgi:hypothetical protein
MIGYKVVQELKGVLCSFNDHNPTSIFYKEYNIGEWTFANEDMLQLGYGLLLFDTLEHAKNFMSIYCFSEISKCIEVEINDDDIIPLPPTGKFVYIGKKFDITDFKTRIEERGSYKSFWDTFPSGTINVKKLYAKKIIPI